MNECTHALAQHTRVCSHTYAYTYTYVHTYIHAYMQNVEQVMVRVLKSTTDKFVAGESATITSDGTATSMYRINMGTDQSLGRILGPAGNSSVMFPASLASELSLSSGANVDVVIHVSQHAPTIGGVVPVTPLVGVTLSRADASGVLAVQGLSQGINITLPVNVSSVPAYRGDLVFSGNYVCMYWNGSVYSTLGCRAADDQVAGQVKCTCNHLTTIVAAVSSHIHVYVHTPATYTHAYAAVSCHMHVYVHTSN
jgi:hypothetical protein